MFTLYRDRTVVAVTTITDDERLYEVPKMTVAALRFTESARARIVGAGGTCLTLDELIMQTPSGTCIRFSFLSQSLICNYNRKQLLAP